MVVGVVGYLPNNNTVLTGDPQVPTPSTTDNDNSAVDSAFVHAVADPSVTSIGGTIASAYTWTLASNTYCVLDKLTLGANTTITVSGLSTGYQYLVITGVQDATGGRTLSINTGSGAVAVGITSTASAGFQVEINWDGTNAFVSVPGASTSSSSTAGGVGLAVSYYLGSF